MKGRIRLSFCLKFMYHLEYFKKSIDSDLKYMVKTVSVIFIHEGAQDKLSGMLAPVYCFFITCLPLYSVFKRTEYDIMKTFQAEVYP